MTTTAPPPPSPSVLVRSPPTKPSAKSRPGTQRRLFSSISRFLSGAKSRPKLARAPASSPSAAVIRPQASFRTDSDHQGGVPLRDVRSESLSTRSGRAPSESTSDSRLDLPTGALVDDAASAISGADTDASIRPITPQSLAPSSVVSHAHTNSTSTNASFANTHRTYKSYASTKPTTLLSVDSGGGGGANRIAVVPGTGGGPLPSSTSGGSLSPISPNGPGGITFSSLPASSPPTPPLSSTPSSSSPLASSQVPYHSYPHPRNNPHPLSPPPDNASMLTLASSSFAPSFFLPGTRTGPTSLLRARHSEADEDASVRALAGSRRASDESLGSRSTWSAAVMHRTGRDDGTASLRTVGTGGTGGGGGIAALGETEAQKVARDADEPAPPALTVAPSGGDPQTTPTAEVDEPAASTVVPPPGSSPLPSPAQDEVPSTPVVRATTPPAHSNGLPHDSDSEAASGVSTPTRGEGRGGKGKGKEVDAASFVSGTETDAQSFVDARSVVHKSSVETLE